MSDREAKFYEKFVDLNRRCNLCPRKCVITSGEKGFCSTRENRNGVLYAINYGQVTNKAFSSIENRSVFHFFPGSNWLSVGSFGCNFRCPGCMHAEIAYLKTSKISSNPSSVYYSPEELVKIAKDNQCNGISWAYSEPTVWFEYVFDTAKLAKDEGLYTNIVTNGYMSMQVLEELAPYIDSCCVDIKGFTDSTYAAIANIESFSDVLSVTRELKNTYTIHVEIITDVITGYNNFERELVNIAAWISSDLGVDTPWHIRRALPCFELEDLDPVPPRMLLKMQELARKQKLRYVYLRNMPRHKGENTYCHKCHKLIIERNELEVVDFKLINGQCPYCKTIVSGRFAEG
ncbi:MAG: AmmeMemoRadiSam system radical SAM enzyme [Candidatus Omnitrophota bacterium]